MEVLFTGKRWEVISSFAHCPSIFSRILYCKEAGAQSNGVSPVAVATMNHYAGRKKPN